MPQSFHRSTFLGAAGMNFTAAMLPRKALAQQTTQLRVAGVFVDMFAEPFFARAAGAFARHGFALEPTSLANAGAVAAAIGGGSLELGVGDLVSGVNAIIKGVPILMIAGGGLYRRSQQEGTILAVAKESPIRSPRDLPGKTIGIPTLVGMTTAILRVWLPENGIAVDSVKLVEVPLSAVLPALQRGTIDVGLLSEPFVTPARDLVRSVGYPNNVVADRTPNKEFPVSVWYAAKTWIEADRARARRVVDAIYETARWANSHQDETLTILVNEGHLDASRLQGLPRTAFATTLTPDMVQSSLDVAYQGKLFPQPVNASELITKL